VNATRRAALLPLLLVVAATGCGSCSRRDAAVHKHAPLPPGEAEAGGPPFQPADTVIDEPAAASAQPATVLSARAADHGNFDRLVVELAGTMPGYRVAWLAGHPHQCGSGAPATVAGGAWLEVRVDPAQAHDAAGRLTLEERSSRPGLPALGALAVTCDFEGVVSWAIGAPARRPFRVLRLLDPPRLVVDVAHAAGGAR